MEAEQLFISPDEAAAILGINKRAVLRMIRAGKLKGKDVNASSGQRKRWKILKEDLLKTTNEENK